MTVRYVAVPAIVVVCLYRVLADRKLLSWDAANVLAAGLSVPLALEIRVFMRVHLGAYLMVAPKTRIAPFSAWQTNASIAWTSLREVYGIDSAPHFGPVGMTVIFGYAVMAAAAIGILRVLWRWRTARRAEQALVIAMAANFMVYMLSTLVSSRSPHDLIALLPCGGCWRPVPSCPNASPVCWWPCPRPAWPWWPPCCRCRWRRRSRP